MDLLRPLNRAAALYRPLLGGWEGMPKDSFSLRFFSKISLRQIY
jgi:hypothetical protein